MIIKKIILLNYRNHESLRIDTNKKIILIYGKNGSGKTNIIESISMLTSSNGLRNSKLESIPNKNFSFSSPRFGANFTFSDSDREFKIGLTFIQNEKKLKKIIKFNNNEMNLNNFSRSLRIFWVLPSIGNFFLGGSSQRRNFLDSLIFVDEDKHINRLNEYHKLQIERLKILKHYSLSIMNQKWLDSVEKKMVNLGVIICDSRNRFIKRINTYSLNNYSNLPIINMKLTGKLDEIFKIKPAIDFEEDFLSILKKNRNTDKVIGKTQSGINRTDVEICVGKNNEKALDSSTGEQKVILVTIIFLFLQILKEQKSKQFICLLDDIFAHLDQGYIDLIIKELVDLGVQTWITNVNEKCIKKDASYLNQVKFLEL